MARLFARLLNKNTLKQVTESIGENKVVSESLKASKLVKEIGKRPEVPFRKVETDSVTWNRYKLVGTFWAIGIPTTLTCFYFLQLRIEEEKKFYYKQIRDEIRASDQI